MKIPGASIFMNTHACDDKVTLHIMRGVCLMVDELAVLDGRKVSQSVKNEIVVLMLSCVLSSLMKLRFLDRNVSSTSIVLTYYCLL